MPVTPKPLNNEADEESPELIVPTTPVRVVEQRGNKTLEYDAQVRSKNAPPDIAEPDSFEFNNDIDTPFIYPQNLPEFAECLSHFKGQELYLVVTRLTDAYDEKYNYPARREMTFSPVPFDAGSILFSLVDILHKLNHNSGGRFNINIASRSGTTMSDIFLLNFTVPDPMRSETGNVQLQQTESGDNNFINGLAMIMQQFQQQAALDRETMLTAIAAMKPEKDRFTALAEKKLEQDILNPPQMQNNANPILGQFAQSIEFAEMLGDIAKGRASSNESGKSVNPYVEFLLGDERIKANVMNGAMNIIGGLAKAGEGALDRAGVGQSPVNQNAAGQQTVDAPEYETIPNAPPPAQPVQNPQPQQEENPNTMIEDMLKELESDRPIDRDNVFINSLKNTYPMYIGMVANACVTMPFESVIGMVRPFAETHFEAFYKIENEGTDDEIVTDELNEYGERMMNRLKEFYDYVNFLQTQPPPQQNA